MTFFMSFLSRAFLEKEIIQLGVLMPEIKGGIGCLKQRVGDNSYSRED